MMMMTTTRGWCCGVYPQLLSVSFLVFCNLPLISFLQWKIMNIHKLKIHVAYGLPTAMDVTQHTFLPSDYCEQSKASQTLTSPLFLCDNFLRLSDNSKAFLFILDMSSYTMLYLTERVRRYSMKSIWRMKGALAFSAMCSECKLQRIQTFMWIFAKFKGNKLTTCS